MIIIDLTQVLFANMHMMKELDENLFRHMALSTIRRINKEFRGEYGELVLAADSYKYWRREYFPEYKAHRKKAREDSGIDFETVFKYFKTVKDELRDNFPYKYIEVESAEADDVIGVLVNHNSDEKCLIISSDKDYQQLQVNPNVDQYDPMRNKFVKCDDPSEYLESHILVGDRGDGIPNILSDDDTFTASKRQVALTAKAKQMLVGVDLPEHKMHRNYVRNRTLIDFECIPDNIRNDIIDKYQSVKTNPRGKLLPYLVKSKLRQLAEKMSDF